MRSPARAFSHAHFNRSDTLPDAIDGRINVAKLRANARLIDMVVQCQRRPFAFRPVPEVQQLLLKTRILEADALYALSLLREPRRAK